MKTHKIYFRNQKDGNWQHEMVAEEEAAAVFEKLINHGWERIELVWYKMWDDRNPCKSDGRSLRSFDAFEDVEKIANEMDSI